jgi:hypothetical protein
MVEWRSVKLRLRLTKCVTRTIPEDMMKHYSPEQVAELEAIGEGWGLIEDADTDEFDEARAKIPKEVGYVYKVADSKPARRGWFS